MPSPRTGVLVIAAVAGAAEVAHATKCANLIRPVEIAPASGATLPPDPVLHVFVPRASNGAVPPVHPIQVLDEAGHLVPSRVETVFHSRPYDVHRIVVARSAGELVVVVGYTVARFSIDPGWRRAATPALEVSTASYFDARGIGLGPDATLRLTTSVEAPAYRIDWSPEVVSGELPNSVVVRPDAGVDVGLTVDADGVLMVGAFGCVGTNLDLDAAVAMRVTALLPDGSEAPGAAVIDARTLIWTLRARHWRKTGSYFGATLHVGPLPQVARRPAVVYDEEAPDRRPGPGRLPVAVGAGLALFVLGLVLRGRLRRRLRRSAGGAGGRR